MDITAHAHVLMVDDHPLYRDGVLQMLSRRAPGLRCHTAGDATEALATLQAGTGVDLVIADFRLPGPMDGVDLLKCVAGLYPTVARVLVSGSDDPRLPMQARRLGLMGFLPKSLEPDRWMQALSSILVGEPWFPAAGAQAVSELTPRQTTILERIASGQTNKAIARDLGVTERTIKYHLGEIFVRAQAGSRAEAVARALAKGWISASTNWQGRVPG